MNKLKQKLMLIIAYLSAIVIANLIVTKFGALSTIPVAFILIGLDLTSRDKLHQLWHNDKLLIKMLLLIFFGSLISYILNRNALQIAVASFIAFFCAGIVDFISYSILYKKKWLVKSNGSNIFSALTDSIIFPTLAFGTFMPIIILGQFAAKTLGGFVWSIVLIRREK